jgi:CTP synthase
MWEDAVDATLHPLDEVTIAVVGKYVDHQDAYKSVGEALKHGGLRQRTKVNLKWLEAQDLEGTDMAALADVDGILVPGGFGDRGFEGKMLTSKFAREQQVPYFGICYGMQAAVVDYARNVVGLEGANSTENDRQPNPVIGLITEWRPRPATSKARRQEPTSAAPCAWALQEQRLKPGTLARELYGGRGCRAPPPPLRVQQPLPHPAGRCRPGDRRQVDGRHPGGSGRAAARCAPVVPGLPGAPGIPVHAA